MADPHDADTALVAETLPGWSARAVYRRYWGGDDIVLTTGDGEAHERISPESLAWSALREAVHIAATYKRLLGERADDKREVDRLRVENTSLRKHLEALIAVARGALEDNPAS